MHDLHPLHALPPQVLVWSTAEYLALPWPEGSLWLCRLPYAVAVVQYKAVAIPLWGCLAFACRYSTLELGFGFGSALGGDAPASSSLSSSSCGGGGGGGFADLVASLFGGKRTDADGRHKKTDGDGEDDSHSRRGRESGDDPEVGGLGGGWLAARDAFQADAVRGAGLPRSLPTVWQLHWHCALALRALGLLGYWLAGCGAASSQWLPRESFFSFSRRSFYTQHAWS